MSESFNLHLWRQRRRPAAALNFSGRRSSFLHAVHRLCLSYATRWFARRGHDPLAALDDEQARQLSELGRERRLTARHGGDESRW